MTLTGDRASMVSLTTFATTSESRKVDLEDVSWYSSISRARTNVKMTKRSMCISLLCGVSSCDRKVKCTKSMKVSSS